MFYGEVIRDLVAELTDALKSTASDQLVYKLFISELWLDELINCLDIPKKTIKK